MTTPAPGPISVTVATDKQTYNVGDPITATVTYTDSTGTTTTLTVDATVTDSSGNTGSGSVTVEVATLSAETFTVAVTDSFGDSYAPGASGPGSAQFTSTVGTPPAG